MGGQPSHYSSVVNVEEGSISIVTASKYGKEGKKTFNFNKAFGPSATQGWSLFVLLVATQGFFFFLKKKTISQFDIFL